VPPAVMALCADTNLICFAALRRQSTGFGLYFLSKVLVCVSAGAVTLRIKDERVVAQQPLRHLRACEPAPHNESGRRLWLSFAEKAHRISRVFDVDLQSQADVALLKARAQRMHAARAHACPRADACDFAPPCSSCATR
jgi:hypothetical protein